MTEFADGGEETGRLRPPGLGLLLAEIRGIFEFNASLMLSPFLMGAPRGDGHPVLTLPGFLASDLSMAPMRRYLTELGYDPHAWRMGRNVGGIARLRSALRKRLAEIYQTGGRKVSIVGWSLGGVYARDLALQAQQLADLTAVVAANGRGQILESAQHAAAQDQGREQLRRFLTQGTGYQPTTVQMFH